MSCWITTEMYNDIQLPLSPPVIIIVRHSKFIRLNLKMQGNWHGQPLELSLEAQWEFVSLLIYFEMKPVCPWSEYIQSNALLLGYPLLLHGAHSVICLTWHCWKEMLDNDSWHWLWSCAAQCPKHRTYSKTYYNLRRKHYYYYPYLTNNEMAYTEMLRNLPYMICKQIWIQASRLRGLQI